MNYDPDLIRIETICHQLVIWLDRHPQAPDVYLPALARIASLSAASVAQSLTESKGKAKTRLSFNKLTRCLQRIYG